MGRLYIVATPIGNLGDITMRAIEVLKNSTHIACEDTRQSKKLLTHIGVSAPLLSCHGHNESHCIPKLLDLLAQDADISYLSDAGTPGISDPGSRLVRAARDAGHDVVPIPGPSAMSALVSVSGIAGRGWFFEGFLPPKGRKRLTRIEVLAGRKEPFILYESPHRIEKLLGELAEGAPGCSVLLGRELTKMYEQIIEFPAETGVSLIESGVIPAKGEFTVLVWTQKKR